MYCTHCGAALSENNRFCSGCGVQTTPVPDSHPYADGGRMGFSNKIHDPAFARFVKSSNRWSGIMAAILAVAAVVGFFIYGEIGSEVGNPEALLIGLGIGGVFLLSWLFTHISSRRSKTWDGVVVDRVVAQRAERRLNNGRGGFVRRPPRHFREYTVVVRDERGKTHRLTAKENDTWYNYFQVGDRVRHHAGLNTYEKYDKSRDSIIYCNACSQVHDINIDICSRCKCPLLK